MDFPIRWQEVLSSVQQAAFSFVFLPMRDEGSPWQVSRSTESVHIGKLILSSPAYTRAGPPCCIMGLHPGNVLPDILVGENPAVAQTFGNQFFKVRGNYPATDFRTPGWIHPPKAWWRDLTLYVLAHFEEDLERLGLYEAVRATCYGIRMSVVNFYAIFE